MSAHPYTNHPWPINLLNALRPALNAAHLLPPLERDALVRKAKKKTGLDDFGDEWFFEPLDVLIKSITEEAALSALGHTIMHKRLLDALMTRLRAEQLFKQHPEILDIDIGHTFVIAGLQRTGTTLLHRLLGSNPNARASLSWEALNPTRLPNETKGDPSGRIKQAKIAQKSLAYIAPTFFAIHPVEYDMPEEDVLFLDLSFMSQSAEATMRVPTYARWLETRDSTPAYEYLKKMMQLLHWQNPCQSTVLKSPHHMEYIDTVLKVFPHSTIIQTHRDPQKTMPSFISMVCHGAGVFSDTVLPQEISNHWQRKVRRLIDLSMAVRDREGEEKFIDVSYYNLTDDPIGELRRIYAKAFVPFNEEAEQCARRLLERQIKNKYGRHIYDAEEFGMSHDQIEQDFGSYRDHYAIPDEATMTPEEPTL